MCVIIAAPSGHDLLDYEDLLDAWNTNADGAGYMFARKGEVVIRKPYYHFGEFFSDYVRDWVEFHKKSPFVLHFRISTHGAEVTGNVHPHFIARGGAGLAHNGILRGGYGDSLGQGDSDTVDFIKQHLEDSSPDRVMSAKRRRKLATQIGNGNKFVLLNYRGRISIVNEEAGEWDQGVWYSNLNHRRSYKTPAYSYHGSASRTEYNQPSTTTDDEPSDADWRDIYSTEDDESDTLAPQGGEYCVVDPEGSVYSLEELPRDFFEANDLKENGLPAGWYWWLDEEIYDEDDDPAIIAPNGGLITPDDPDFARALRLLPEPEDD